jgi:hypothetical protein
MERLMESGTDIAQRVDPNTSNDVCTFCRHATLSDDLMTPPKCALGLQGYFRSLSQFGAIWVSDCEKGELRPDLAALEKQN